jgi:uncharacterized Ntn-hydrolase superfamily protein
VTFSLAARCPRTGQLGVGALTAMVGVGKLVPHVSSRVGAIASQATLNPYLGIDGIRLLTEGRSAQEALDAVVAADPGRETRQCGVIDSQGRTAAWTGSLAPDWSGHLAGDGVIAQGNRLVGRETLEEAVAAFEAHPDEELAVRLLLAIEAGEATGADTDGAKSGAVLVMEHEEYPLWDARVDHADDPARSLRDLMGEMAEELVPEVRRLPTRRDPMGQAAREMLEG